MPWDEGTAIYQAGDFVSVPPGSALESAIGLSNMTPATAAQLASGANGTGGGWVSN